MRLYLKFFVQLSEKPALQKYLKFNDGRRKINEKFKTKSVPYSYVTIVAKIILEKRINLWSVLILYRRRKNL